VVLLICSAAQFMVVLDATIVIVALPQMREALQLSATEQQWIVNAYALTFAGFLLLGGRAGDLFGRRRVFLVGVGVFTLFSLLGGLAGSGGALIAARAVQGLGGAIMAPATLSLLTSTFTELHERRRALGVWSATAASGAAGGVLVGGILTDLLDWRWVLFVNVPIGIALLIGTALYVREQESTPAESRRKLDVAGAVTVSGGLAALVYAISGTDTHPWGSSRTLGTLAVAVLLLLTFVLIEARFATSPMVPLAVFRRRSLSAANAIALTLGGVLFGLYYFLSLDLQQVDGYSPLRTGLAILPVGLTTLTAALCASRLVHRIGVRRLLVAAPLLTAAGLLWISRVSVGSGYLSALFVPLIIVGAGIGLTFMPMTLAATAGVPAQLAGLAAGLINTSRQIGGALGLAVLFTIAASVSSRPSPGPVTSAAALSAGYDRAFLVLAGLSVLGALASVALPRPERARAAVSGAVQAVEQPTR
jgi:EmrB/QacA subfamily drug resistance transporter